ncbi:MAG: hypothetical protein Q8K92_24065 [Leadbetterella sp.]|nr:hypothetical protein [Leadbetterella sp.]
MNIRSGLCGGALAAGRDILGLNTLGGKTSSFTRVYFAPNYTTYFGGNLPTCFDANWWYTFGD